MGNEKQSIHFRLVRLDNLGNSDDFEGYSKVIAGYVKDSAELTWSTGHHRREPISSHPNFGSPRLPRGAETERMIYYRMEKRQLWDRGFRRTHPCKLRGTLRLCVLRILLNLVKSISPHWGGQNLTAVERSKCINLLLWICMRLYFTISGSNLEQQYGGEKMIYLKRWIGQLPRNRTSNVRGSIIFNAMLLTTVEWEGKERFMHNSKN